MNKNEPRNIWDDRIKMKVLKIFYKYAFKNMIKIKLERLKREPNESLGLKNTLSEIKISLNGLRTY